jgi:hypothetical protein
LRYFDYSPTDRAMAVLSEDSGFVPQLALALDGPLDRDRLGGALDLLTRRHPILGSTLDSAPNGTRWQPETTAPVLLARDDGIPLDVRDGPTCFLAYDDAALQLSLTVHHAVCDGRGIVVLLEDLRAIYTMLGRGEPALVDVDWSDRTIDALLARRHVGVGDRARMAADAAARWARVPASTHRDVAATGDDGAVDVVVELDRRRRNHVLVALLARAWLDVVGPEATSPSASCWLVTVDCRRRLGTARGVGNLSGLEPLVLRDLESLGLAGTVDAVRDGFAAFAAPGAGMAADLASAGAGRIPSTVLDRAVRDTFAMRASALRHTRLYSHVELDPAALADWGDARVTRAWWVPNGMTASPYVAMLLASFGAATTLTFVASRATLPTTTARAMAEHVVGSLARLSEHPSEDARIST